MFLESDELLKAHHFPTSVAFRGRSLHINLALLVTLAYFYQFFFKTIRAAQAEAALEPHELKRSKIENTAIKQIHENLRRHGKLARNPVLIGPVLEAMLMTVAAEIGGYAEMEKLEANLLIQPSDNVDHLRVIARYGNTRDCPKDYAMTDRSFCAAMWRGDATAEAAGNIAILSPETGRGAPYKDILRLPVLDLNGNIAAAVSIDSTEAYHFPQSRSKIRKIEFEVSPYVALLRMILDF